MTSSSLLPVFPIPYKTMHNLAHGGQGSTWLVFNQDEGTQAVAKIAPIAVIQHEAAMLAHLQHSAVPRLITTLSLPTGEAAMISEYMEGVTLEQFIADQGPQFPALVRRWALQLGEILLVAHTQRTPIVHRDIKPANIILRPSGALALVDFGIARTYKIGQTHDTLALGSPGYAAPEAYGKAQTDARSDLYSLAATLIYCITGHDMSLTPLRPPTLDHLGDRNFADILTETMSIDPLARPQSTEEWVTRLGGVVPAHQQSRPSAPTLALNGSLLLPILGGAYRSGPTQQIVVLPTFALAREPITVEQWRMYIAQGGRGLLPSPTLANTLPMHGVSWQEAERYCAFYGLRLPSALEWEKGARGTDGRRYPWGDQFLVSEVVARPNSQEIQALAQRGRSPYGATELLGGVWEWSSTRVGLAAVACGGSYKNEGTILTCWTQQRFASDVRQEYVGFRVAR